MGTFFIWLLGLCVGSFLNVVIYRLPRGISIGEPVWSFCPMCKNTLLWHDNLPLVGWLRLRGRCRSCGVSISAQYPLIEALCGLTFVVGYHLLCNGARADLSFLRFPADAPFVLAWLILLAVLLALAAMDITSYLVDTRLTDLTVAAAIILYAAWPRPASTADAGSAVGAAGITAFLASVLMLWLTVWRAPFEPVAAEEPAPAMEPRSAPTLGISLAVLAISGVALAIAVGDIFSDFAIRTEWRILPPLALLLLFAAMALSARQPRAADQEIHEAITSEAPSARRLALSEALWLLPIAAAAAGAYWLYLSQPEIESAWRSACAWPLGSSFKPLAGAVHAMTGAMLGAALGWAIRLAFTMLFGQEAFGVGDIYILAAAGAAAGADIALLGFLLAVPIALCGWLLSLTLKRTNMIPFGPPLALGFVAALWLHQPATRFAHDHLAPSWQSLRELWAQNPALLLPLAGVLLLGLGVSLLLSRGLRSLATPALEPALEVNAPSEPVEKSALSEQPPVAPSAEPTEPAREGP